MATRGPAGGAPALVQSVDRALRVLEILALRGEAGVTEIAGELGVHKSTASRLVAGLESRGFVEQLTDRGRYRLGVAVVRLAGALTAQRDLAAESRPACEALALELGETVNLAILDGARVVNLSQARGPAAIGAHNWVGQSTPPHATSSGKVLLAYAAGVDLAALLGDPLPRFTDATVRSVEALRIELERVRSVGWALAVEEYEPGLTALAAPVRNADGAVVAAVSVSAPTYRLAPPSFDRVAARLVAACRDIGRRLGHHGS